MEASYNYYSPFAQGGFKIQSFNYARLAVKKGFMDYKAQLTLAFNDIFKGQVYRTDMGTNNLISRLNVYNDSRRVSIGFTYRFGKTTIKNALYAGYKAKCYLEETTFDPNYLTFGVRFNMK